MVAKKSLLMLSIILLSIISVTGNSQTEKEILSATLTFHANSFNSDKGNAVIFLFRKTGNIPKSPFLIARSSVKNGKAEISFANLPFGDYAAILLHDENANGEIDHSWGIPSEPLGYTNNWTLSLFSGMPSFEKLKFNFSPVKTQQTISISFNK